MPWAVRVFQSGTTIVTSDDPNASHYYIFPHARLCSGAADELYVERTRYEAAKELAAWLNGEVPKHPWITAGERESDDVAQFKGRGVTIHGVGPMRDPSGQLNWTVLPEEAHLRKALIDKLVS